MPGPVGVEAPDGLIRAAQTSQACRRPQGWDTSHWMPCTAPRCGARPAGRARRTGGRSGHQRRAVLSISCLLLPAGAGRSNLDARSDPGRGECTREAVSLMCLGVLTRWAAAHDELHQTATQMRDLYHCVCIWRIAQPQHRVLCFMAVDATTTTCAVCLSRRACRKSLKKHRNDSSLTSPALLGSFRRVQSKRHADTCLGLVVCGEDRLAGFVI